MADDKLFIKQAAEVHQKNKTPHKAILFQTFAIIIFFLLLMREFTMEYRDPYEVGHALYIFLNLIVLFVTILAVTVWRFRDPEMLRPFKAPFGKVGPIIMLMIYTFCFGAWLYLDNLFAMSIVKRGIVIILFGLPLYLLIETHYDKHFIVKTNDVLAYFTLFVERFSMPDKIVDSIMFLLGDVRGRKVLEYGCSVGTLTSHLAEKVLPGGVVYATDLSIKRATIAEKRIRKNGHYHVQIIHDEEHATRVHPHVPIVDVVVSVSMVGYVLEIEKVLQELNKRLPVGGKICIVENDKFFKFIPNVHWLSKDTFIREVFDKAGFKVDVTRTDGLFWEYVFIYGEKEKDVGGVALTVPKDVSAAGEDESEEEEKSAITDTSQIEATPENNQVVGGNLQ